MRIRGLEAVVARLPILSYRGCAGLCILGLLAELCIVSHAACPLLTITTVYRCQYFNYVPNLTNKGNRHQRRNSSMYVTIMHFALSYPNKDATQHYRR